MIGLGGAEFRLSLLIGLFGFAALQAVIMNKAMSRIVVMTALPARLLAVPFDTVKGYWFVVVNLLAGSLVGAWIGATLMGVAGGELLIPTIVLLFAVDIKIAGSLALAIPCPPCS